MSSQQREKFHKHTARLQSTRVHESWVKVAKKLRRKKSRQEARRQEREH